MNCHIKILVLAFVLIAGTTSAQGPTSAQIGCAPDGVKQDACKLSWNLMSAGGNPLYLERFDGEKGRWSVIQEQLPSTGSTEEAVAPGSLYRVVACDSDLAAQCVSTYVYWAPVIPTSPSDIPALVERSPGAVMKVSKNARLYTQTLQYNVYLLAAELEGADWKSLPEMAPPPEDPETLADYIHANVWMSYAGDRNDALDIAGDPASVEPEIGYVIHPEGHPSPSDRATEN